MRQPDTSTQEAGASPASGTSESSPAHLCPVAHGRQVGPGGLQGGLVVSAC